MTQPLLQLDDVSIHFKTHHGVVKAVRNVSVNVHKGECYALIGESGSGKSTLAFAAMSYLPENGYLATGRVLFNGEDITKYNHIQLQHLRGSRIAMVFQNPHTAANPCYTIGEQLIETQRVHKKISSKEGFERAVDMLATINIPDPARIMAQYPHQISGGQKQRITIAQALLCDPELIIMDEPTTALDVTTEIQFLRMLEDLRKRIDQAILYITHDMGVVARVADRVGVLYAGTLLEEGSREAVFTRSAHPYTQGLMRSIPSMDKSGKGASTAMPGLLPNLLSLHEGCVFSPRCPLADAACKNDAAETVLEAQADNGKTGHRVFCHHHGRLPDPEAPKLLADKDVSSADIKPLLEVEGLKTYYGSASFFDSLMGKKPRYVFAVDDVSFTLNPGETLGIVGESGCGKSTLGKTLVRLINSSGGSVRYNGKSILDAKYGDPILCKDMQIIFQSPDSSLNPRHSIYTLISRPLFLHNLVKTRAEAEARCKQLLDMVRLPHTYLFRKPHQLSGGEKQRVAIARAFAVEPQFVVCDEVTSALDVSVQASVINLLRELQQELNVSYLFISHDLTAVRQISHRIAVMYLGRVVEIGNTEQVFQPPYHPYTKALLSSVSLPRIVQPHTSILLQGNIPNPASPPSGCAFHTRCYKAMVGECTSLRPELCMDDQGHSIACHLPLDTLRADSAVFDI